MMSLSGWGYCYLAGAIEDGRWKYSPVTIRARRDPWFRGTCADFIAQNPRLAHHLVNLVRVCPACSKSCARSVPACNNCATDLSLEPVTRTDNALMGFVYGIAAFPTSIRYEDEHFLVYDDLMQTTLIHLNAIPTDTYVPDLRYLFSDPRRGLELIKRLFALAVRAAVEILSVDDFAVKFFSPAALSLMEQLGKQTFVERKVLAGFNFPPSQWQLHLQFILPPYGPFHGVLLNEGKHTDMDRFLPFDFVKDCLEVLEGKDEKISLSEIETFSGFQLVECLHQRTGVDYYKSYYAAVSDVKLNDALCGNWKSEDFEFVVVDKRVVFPVSALDRGIPESTEGWAQCAITPSELQKRDKQTIQSYGKGMGLQYYSFAKNPGQVRDWHTPDP